MIKSSRLALWALTPHAAALAGRLCAGLPGSELYLPGKEAATREDCLAFDHFGATVREKFREYDGHIFVMAVGIVVRVIDGLPTSKVKDPAVVVMDDAGRFAISLLSGHIGGANALARHIAGLTGAQAVITTATDTRQLPAVDNLAKAKGWRIENPQAVKTIHMALLNRQSIALYDPMRLMDGQALAVHLTPVRTPAELPQGGPGMFIHHFLNDAPDGTLLLRPPTLTVGVGCNRHAPAEEIKTLYEQTLAAAGLCPLSVTTLASIDLKADEPGLLEMSQLLDIPLRFFSAAELNAVIGIENPSAMAEKYVGVKSVCEAAAILAAHQGTLLVPKQISKNVTMAVASMSSA